MRFCQDHWDRLREAIVKRGMGGLIAEDGKRAAENAVRELETGETTPATFDPLMGAHWAIANNALRVISESGGGPASAMYVMEGDDRPEDRIDPERYSDARGRTWPRCPLCYLGIAHELTCRNPACKLEKVNGYDWMIARAADEQEEKWKALQAEPDA